MASHKTAGGEGETTFGGKATWTIPGKASGKGRAPGGKARGRGFAGEVAKAKERLGVKGGILRAGKARGAAGKARAPKKGGGGLLGRIGRAVRGMFGKGRK